MTYDAGMGAVLSFQSSRWRTSETGPQHVLLSGLEMWRENNQNPGRHIDRALERQNVDPRVPSTIKYLVHCICPIRSELCRVLCTGTGKSSSAAAATALPSSAIQLKRCGSRNRLPFPILIARSPPASASRPDNTPSTLPPTPEVAIRLPALDFSGPCTHTGCTCYSTM